MRKIEYLQAPHIADPCSPPHEYGTSLAPGKSDLHRYLAPVDPLVSRTVALSRRTASRRRDTLNEWNEP